MKLVVVSPHFSPDVAPTGTVMTGIVQELAGRGHSVEVITALPWYREHRIERGYEGRLYRYEDTPWGRITRIHPFPTSDKRRIIARAAAFGAFSAMAAALGSRGSEVNAVLAVSPPLTLGMAGAAIARARRAPFVFNVQDVYPGLATELKAVDSALLVGVARRIERLCYRRADAVTVLSEEPAVAVRARIDRGDKVHVIPNFVDTAWIVPGDRNNDYRHELGLGDKTVVMYAGNVGLSQSLDIVVDAASALAYEPDLVFVINGQGAARPQLEARARGLPNVVFVDMQPLERLPRVLAAADIHVVPLRRGLSRYSVPSKTYSIMAAGRPFIASVDEGSEPARLAERSGAGVAVPPEDSEAFTKALRRMLDSPDEAAAMGQAGRRFIETWASPAAVAAAYERLFLRLSDRGSPARAKG